MSNLSPRLLDQVRGVLRRRHYSSRTEATYIDWIVRFIRFHHVRHPSELGAPEIAAFLTHLAVDNHVAASTQNQARSAVLFLYREVLGIVIENLPDIATATKPRRLPTVLSRTEVRALLT